MLKYVPDTKQPLDYKNMDLKMSKNLHFSKGLASWSMVLVKNLKFFPSFSFGQFREGKRV